MSGFTLTISMTIFYLRPFYQNFFIFRDHFGGTILRGNDFNDIKGLYR